MYLYLSEHALMDYHLNEEKKIKEGTKSPKEDKEPDNGTSTDRTE